MILIKILFALLFALLVIPFVAILIFLLLYLFTGINDSAEFIYDLYLCIKPKKNRIKENEKKEL